MRKAQDSAAALRAEATRKQAIYGSKQKYCIHTRTNMQFYKHLKNIWQNPCQNLSLCQEYSDTVLSCQRTVKVLALAFSCKLLLNAKVMTLTMVLLVFGSIPKWCSQYLVTTSSCVQPKQEPCNISSVF